MPKWSFIDFEIEPETPFGNRKLFSQNLTYSYSFLGWKSPGFTMSLESLHNYFVITVKNRKNHEKIGFFDFCLWSRYNVGIIATYGNLREISRQKTLSSTFFSTKKKNTVRHPQMVVFAILRPNLRPLSGIENFFFSKFNFLVQFFEEKFTENYHVVGIIT